MHREERIGGVVFLIIGIILVLIGSLTDWHFILDYEGTIKDRLFNQLFWIFIGVLILLLGFATMRLSNFYRDKLSKTFSRGMFEKDPNLLISYYHSVYDLKRTLQNNQIQFNLTTVSVLNKRRGLKYG